MAILGGGPGGGGPVGVANSFTGAAQALEIYGDFGAAYSGQVQVNTSAVEHLNFTTGNYLFVGELTITGAINASDPTNGLIAIPQINFNGVGVMKLKVETGYEQMPSDAVVPIIIPAYTEVLVEVTSQVSTAGYTTSANLTGTIHRQ